MADKIRYEKERERLTDQYQKPPEELIRIFMGEEAWRRLGRFEEMLRERYQLNRELKFPFGNTYGWGFRYAHKKSLLLYVFIEEGGFCCTISISDKGARQMDSILGELPRELQEAWLNRYARGAEGGWLNRFVKSDDELPGLVRLVGVKVKPVMS